MCREKSNSQKELGDFCYQFGYDPIISPSQEHLQNLETLMKNSNLNRGLIDQIDRKNIINQDKILIKLKTQKIRNLVRSAILL